MGEQGEDDGVHIELNVSIYGASDKHSKLVAETAVEAATAMEDMGISGADIVVGLIVAAIALIDDNGEHVTMH